MSSIRWWLGCKCIRLASLLLPPGDVSYRRAAPDQPGEIVRMGYTKEQITR